MSGTNPAGMTYASVREMTRREVFPEETSPVGPCNALLELIEPYYPVARRGRRSYPLEARLRVHLMQKRFALSVPAMEAVPFEISSLPNVAGLSL